MPHVCTLLILLTVSYLPTSAVAQRPAIQFHPDFAQFFRDAGTIGTIVVMDVHRQTVDVYNPARADVLFPPASTFKILNSLIALETGVVTDVDTQIFKWDGVDRGSAGWNKDLTLRSAFATSAFHVYQKIARDIGLARMTGYLDQVGYGRGKVTKQNLDWFWVQKGFRISAYEQIQFLRRLYLEDLPFSRKSIKAVKDISIVERGEGYVLHGKTGWTTDTVPSIGWFVGWIERGDEASVFALNMDMNDLSQAAARITITREVLMALDLL
ncbi:MAG: class D beta-lactamase [Rhodospirillaceae bacterium]